MSTASSDYQVDGVNPLISTREALYSDISLLFQQHPNTKGIQPITDINAIKQSVKNLVITNFGERPFQPEIGSSISNLLFENADFFVGDRMRSEILRVLNRFEPRVEDVVVRIFESIDTHSIRVDIGFRIVNTPLEGDVSFNLNRVR
jgi:phage baseplate assembly protein W